MSALDDKTWEAVLAHEDTELDGPATAKVVAGFEASHGIALPQSHREFLLRGNGGVVGYARLFGVGRPDALDLTQMVSEMRPYIGNMADGPVFPFANDWGGSYFCYDLRRLSDTGDYPVLFWKHEYSEEPDDRPMLWSEFASSFLAFVQKVIA